MTLILALIILIYSVILHELAHGVVALLNGDRTARDAGRLTLNPLPHIDPFGSIVLPVVLLLTGSNLFFAWAKPVPFNPRNFKNKRLGVFTVGVAGPLTNIALAVLFSLALRVAGTQNMLFSFFFYGASVNVFLALFNLVPIPPLDGSRAVGVLMPGELKSLYYSLERWGFLIVIVLVTTGVLGRVIGPLYRLIFGRLTGLL